MAYLIIYVGEYMTVVAIIHGASVHGISGKGLGRVLRGGFEGCWLCQILIEFAAGK